MLAVYFRVIRGFQIRHSEVAAVRQLEHRVVAGTGPVAKHDVIVFRPADSEDLTLKAKLHGIAVRVVNDNFRHVGRFYGANSPGF